MNVYDLPRGEYDIRTPGDFIKSVSATLVWWLMVHIDADTWASNQIIGDDPIYLLKEIPVLSWLGREYDFASACVERLVKRQVKYYYRCSLCGSINYNGEYCDYDHDDEDGREPQEEEVSWEDLYHFWRDCYYSGRSGWDKTWIEEMIPEYIIQEALREDAFPAYRQIVSTFTNVDDVIEEVRDAICQLNDAVLGVASREIILETATWAAHIRHVHGKIMQDYADEVGADGREMDRIQQDGLETYLGSDTVSLWLKGDIDPGFESEWEDLSNYTERVPA